MEICRFKAASNYWNNARICLFLCNSFPSLESSNVSKRASSPPLGDAVCDFRVLVAGEAEVYEPLLIQPLRRFLQ